MTDQLQLFRTPPPCPTCNGTGQARTYGGSGILVIPDRQINR
jgi:hypothetical protein